MGTTPTTVKIDPAIKDRLAALAESRQRSPHWLLREAVEQYVDREEKREKFRQDALAAWENYQATGAHCSAEDADAWLAQLEAGGDVEPPACRG